MTGPSRSAAVRVSAFIPPSTPACCLSSRSRLDYAGANVRVEARLDRTLAVRHGERYLPIQECVPGQIAPGGWFTIKGTNLSDGKYQAVATPLPQTANSLNAVPVPSQYKHFSQPHKRGHPIPST